jgi:DNA polymerase-1
MSDMAVEGVQAPLGADLASVAFGPHHAAVRWSDGARTGSVEQIVSLVGELEASHRPRWVWWAADPHAVPLVSAGLVLGRCWDLAEAHRILAGGWEADPGHVWARAHGLDPAAAPRPTAGDLFDFTSPTEPGLTSSAAAAGATRADGHLHPEVLSPDFLGTPDGVSTVADLALRAAVAQRILLAQRHIRAVSTAYSESAAALLCLELSRDGLPVHRQTLESLIAAAAGPRPESERHAMEIRRERDLQVLRHVPGRESTDLRNPVHVRELLRAVGVVVPDTRAWRLEPFRATHPLVEALLQWRKAERIATTYGYSWLTAHVGSDDRLRGGWTACDGAAGRMTAQNGLHNLPAPLRPAVAAHPGHVFVRADLGQIEPRVLAAVSGDRRFAAAAQSDDLYAPVAADLGVDRPVAKVAVLAAMYGQTSGPAGEALRGMERSYPVALAYLRSAADAGAAGRAVQTYGGRRVPVPTSDTPAGRAAHGRFARNAVVQGAAAELFKAWAATVRLAVAPLGAQIVLCLHDELLLHVPLEHSAEVAALVTSCLDDAARRWTGSRDVRFVADTSIIERWSDAKP